MSDSSRTEPWLRGDIVDVHPLIAQVLYSLRHAEEDLELWTRGLSADRIWARPHGLASVGFQFRHILGSIDRLLTYAQGEALSASQLEELRAESHGSEEREILLALLSERLRDSARVLRGFDPATFTEPRTVGKKHLPTTVAGLIVHIAEHTQRHVGQAIVTAKLVKGD